MAAANIFTVEEPPSIEYVVNNQGGNDLRCLNYAFHQKTCGKKSSSFVCTGKGCCPMIPCVWVYMKRRRTKDYIRVLNALKSAALHLGFSLNPIQVMIDCELAAKKAFEQIFQQCTVKGCLFHFGQSLFKKFCAIGLKNDYLNIEEVQVWFKSMFCLALIPINNIEQQFELLSNQMRYSVSRHLSVNFQVQCGTILIITKRGPTIVSKAIIIK